MNTNDKKLLDTAWKQTEDIRETLKRIVDKVFSYNSQYENSCLVNGYMAGIYSLIDQFENEVPKDDC